MQPIHVTSIHPQAPVKLPRRFRREAGGWRGRIGCGALLATLLALDAHAITLGRAQVWSALGEPLRAEVELSGLGAEEAATLRVEIAPPEAYQQARLEYHPLLGDLHVTLDRRANGSVRVHLSGSRAASVPYLQLLLRASSNDGQVTRGYTLLLDPNAGTTAPPREAVAAPVPRQAAPAFERMPARQAGSGAAPVPDASAPALEHRVVPGPPPVPAPTAAASTDSSPATLQASGAPATTAAAVPQPAAPASPRKQPDASPALSISTGYDRLLQSLLLAAATGTLALLGLLVWIRRRQQASGAVGRIEPSTMPAEPMPAAAPFGTVLAAAMATTPDTGAPTASTRTDGLDLDLAALEQVARTPAPETDPRQQNPAGADQSGEVPLDFSPTLPVEAGLPDSAQAAVAPGDDPMAGKLALAARFQALRDTEGARLLAEEVSKNTTGDLQTRARALLAQLG